MKSTEPLVCICVPCYNSEETIKDTLDSLINQSYSNFIVKVFDNASTDSTRDIVRSYMESSTNIFLYENEVNIGGEANFSKCIEAGEGDYTAIFHADDFYSPEMISSQVRFIEQNKSCVAVATNAFNVNEKGEVVGTRFIPPELSNEKHWALERNEFIRLVFNYGNFITFPSVLFNTVVLKTKLKEFRAKLFNTSADLDVWLRTTEFGQLGYITKPLMYYRVSEASYSYNIARVRVQDHDLFLVLNYYLNKEADPDLKKELLKRCKFLLMKDRANTNLNRYILHEKGFQNIGLVSNIATAVKSKFHLKYFGIAFVTQIIIAFPHSEKLSKVIKRLRFGRDA